MQLAPHVHVASVEGDLIFLDARSDRYSCITRSEAHCLLSLLSGEEPNGGEQAEFAQELLEAGLLLPGRGRPFTAPEHHPPSADFHTIAAPAPRASARTLWRLACSALEAGLKLHRGPIRWLRRQPRWESDVPVSRAATIAMQFDGLRPWIPRSGRCLPSSLILLAFLRRHGILAHLVLGVHTFPFEAHSWVEYRGVVLNDTIEHVRWYTPIAIA